ncbi:MAG: HDOD domain-containing protein [Proteobacteria bacterium]|nr:HDOD domain-containing protein [Pseudomonadota bacterium]MBU1708905.1 HDOD domain-containing protein [Pseudomonadota bacterium]
MSRLEEILENIKQIPPFPKVAKRVMELIENPDVSAVELGKIIQYDQSITANVLKMCNSAYFGLGRKVSSLEQGLVVLGNNVLKDIIITSSSSDFYKGVAGEGYVLEEGELWRHSVATGIMAKLLIRHVKDIDAGTAYTAALLHDIGKRVMSSYVAEEFKEIMEIVTTGKCSFSDAEKKVLGVTHAELGGMILEKWEFSQEMIDAVKQHHDPEALLKEPLSAVVCLSNALVISLGIGAGATGLAMEMQGDGLKRFGLANKDLDLLMADLFEEMAKAEDLIQL